MTYLEDEIPVGVTEVEAFPTRKPTTHLEDDIPIGNIKVGAFPTGKPTKPVKAQRTAKTARPPVNRTGLINGAHAVRGMSLLINDMLAMGCFTVQDFLNCLIPLTKDKTEKQARAKLTSHVRNLAQNNCYVRTTDAKTLVCADVTLPELH